MAGPSTTSSSRAPLPQLRLRGKLALAFGLELALVAGVAAAGLLGLRSVKGSFQAAIEHGLASERLAVELRSELLEARRSEKDFLLTWPTEGFAQARDRHVVENQRHVGRIRELIGELEGADAHGGAAYPPRRTTEDVVALKPYVDVYAEDFTAAVGLIGQRAQSDRELEQRFRTMVNALVAHVRGGAAYQSLAALLMQLRQRERDTLMRGDRTAPDDVHAIMNRVRGQLSTSTADRAQIDALTGRYLETFDELAALERRIAAKIADFHSAAIVVEPLVSDIANAGQRAAAAEVSAAQMAWSRTLLTVGIILVAAMLTGLALAYLLGRQISAPLSSLARTAERIGGGDLTASVEVRSADEIGILATAFNAMAARLRGLVRSLEERVLERERAEEQVRRLNSELEQRVRARTAELESANRELEAFSYSVSHDLRTPLRHIAGFVYLLKQRPEQQDQQGREHLDTIAAAVRRMGSLIDALLAFSRIGRAEFKTIDLDLEELVEEARSELAGDIKDRPITWEIGPLPHVQGDRALLRQVIVNLLANAVKFTRPRERAEIQVRAAPEHATLHETVFLVRDNGVGFDMAFVDKLFGVFKRLHAPEAFEGTGIGLANVERIVRRHGGRVWAEGAVGVGATFFVALPRPRAPGH